MHTYQELARFRELGSRIGEAGQGSFLIRHIGTTLLTQDGKESNSIDRECDPAILRSRIPVFVEASMMLSLAEINTA